MNYKENIGGLKIPLTYEEVIKNPNFLKDLDTNKNSIKSKEYIEVDQYKIKKAEVKKK